LALCMEFLGEDHVRIVTVEVLGSSGGDRDLRSCGSKLSEIPCVVDFEPVPKLRLASEHFSHGAVWDIRLSLGACGDRDFGADLALTVSAEKGNPDRDQRLAVLAWDPQRRFPDPAVTARSISEAKDTRQPPTLYRLQDNRPIESLDVWQRFDESRDVANRDGAPFVWTGVLLRIPQHLQEAFACLLLVLARRNDTSHDLLGVPDGHPRVIREFAALQFDPREPLSGGVPRNQRPRTC
jgi:hypothetical protein